MKYINYMAEKHRIEKEEDMAVSIRPAPLMEGMQFGCDPELFVVDQYKNYVCADGLLPGSKAEPYEVEGGAIQVDGFAAEVNTTPATTFGQFNKNLDKVIGQVRRMLPKGFDVVASPTATFSEEVWDAAPERAKELGCSPDYNAWLGTVNTPPDGDAIPRFRTAAGHVHIGWTKGAQIDDMQHIMNCRDLVKQLDMYLGAWSIPKEGAEGVKRRSLYGKAGACRIKDYGVEYRVLGNFWVLDKEERQNVWNRTCRAIEYMKNNYGFMPDILQRYNFENYIKDYISTGHLDGHVSKIFTFPLTTLDARQRKF
jgi:hypothetical protein